jgi:predicted nucleic acid-binding protein
LDSLNQARLRLEAEAVLGILEFAIADEIEIIASTVLELEINRNPFSIRREHGLQVLNLAKETITVDESVEQRAREFVSLGFAPMDALHLAAAEKGRGDYFCTCDDKIMRKAANVATLTVKVVSPLGLIEVLGK